jgi:peroxiredoxin
VTLPLLARRSSLVIFFYPGTKETTTPSPGQSVSADERRAVGWMRCESELSRMGYEVIGVSAQSAIEQARFATRDPLPYMLLSDPTLKLAAILTLPTISFRDTWAYAPLVLVVRNQRIVRVFYPIDPTSETSVVMPWIRSSPSKDGYNASQQKYLGLE